MGLDDAVPEDVKSSASSSSADSGSDSSSPNTITIGKEPYKKEFTEDHWEEIKKVLPRELGFTVNEAKNLPADERYEIFHEAGLIAHSEMEAEESEYRKKDQCPICGTVLHEEATAEIAGETFCPDHPAAKIANHFES